MRCHCTSERAGFSPLREGATPLFFLKRRPGSLTAKSFAPSFRLPRVPQPRLEQTSPLGVPPSARLSPWCLQGLGWGQKGVSRICKNFVHRFSLHLPFWERDVFAQGKVWKCWRLVPEQPASNRRARGLVPEGIGGWGRGACSGPGGRQGGMRVTASWTERQMQRLTVIKTRRGLLVEGGLGCTARLKITPCCQIGHGHFPWWDTANLEKTGNLELGACRAQDFLNFRGSQDSSVSAFSFPLCVCVGMRRLRGAGSPRPLLACAATHVVNNAGD